EEAEPRRVRRSRRMPHPHPPPVLRVRRRPGPALAVPRVHPAGPTARRPVRDLGQRRQHPRLDPRGRPGRCDPRPPRRRRHRSRQPRLGPRHLVRRPRPHRDRDRRLPARLQALRRRTPGCPPPRQRPDTDARPLHPPRHPRRRREASTQHLNPRKARAMAQYTINYLTGDEETVSAVTVNMNSDGSEYRFPDRNGRIVAYVPARNVLSIILTEEPEAVTG